MGSQLAHKPRGNLTFRTVLRGVFTPFFTRGWKSGGENCVRTVTTLGTGPPDLHILNILDKTWIFPS